MSNTSKEAIDHLEASGKCALLRNNVAKVLATWPIGMTASEVAYMLDVPRDTISPRLAELYRMGMVKKIDTRKCKETGRRCIIWSLGGTEMPKKKTQYERGFDDGYQQAKLELERKEHHES